MILKVLYVVSLGFLIIFSNSCKPVIKGQIFVMDGKINNSSIQMYLISGKEKINGLYHRDNMSKEIHLKGNMFHNADMFINEYKNFKHTGYIKGKLISDNLFNGVLETKNYNGDFKLKIKKNYSIKEILPDEFYGVWQTNGPVLYLIINKYNIYWIQENVTQVYLVIDIDEKYPKAYTRGKRFTLKLINEHDYIQCYTLLFDKNKYNKWITIWYWKNSKQYFNLKRKKSTDGVSRSTLLKLSNKEIRDEIPKRIIDFYEVLN